MGTLPIARTRKGPARRPGRSNGDRPHSRRLGREQRVDEILIAAREVFCAKGYEGAAVSEIAARMGLVEANVYKYFGSKRQLLLKVLNNWYDGMFGDYATALDGVIGTRARVKLLVLRHLQSVKQDPRLCRLMFREVRSEQDYPGSSLHAQNRRYTQLLVDVLKDGIAAGELRRDASPALLRDLIYGGIEHHAWAYITAAAEGGGGRRRGSLNPERLADDIVDLVFAGAATGSKK